jgi:hypothetical protein
VACVGRNVDRATDFVWNIVLKITKDFGGACRCWE